MSAWWKRWGEEGGRNGRQHGTGARANVAKRKDGGEGQRQACGLLDGDDARTRVHSFAQHSSSQKSSTAPYSAGQHRSAQDITAARHIKPQHSYYDFLPGLLPAGTWAFLAMRDTLEAFSGPLTTNILPF